MLLVVVVVATDQFFRKGWYVVNFIICLNYLLLIVATNKIDQLPISVGPGFGDSVTRLLGGPGTHSGMSASCSEFELAAINTQFKIIKIYGIIQIQKLRLLTMLMIVNRYFNNLVYWVYPQLKYTIVSELFQEGKVKTCLIPVMSLRVV